MKFINKIKKNNGIIRWNFSLFVCSDYLTWSIVFTNNLAYNYLL
nr:MAG TPA: hypothetical protein [Bacteriophage sp.]